LPCEGFEQLPSEGFKQLPCEVLGKNKTQGMKMKHRNVNSYPLSGADTGFKFP